MKTYPFTVLCQDYWRIRHVVVVHVECEADDVNEALALARIQAADKMRVARDRVHHLSVARGTVEYCYVDDWEAEV